MTMPAISLWQPWASLLVTRQPLEPGDVITAPGLRATRIKPMVKRFETRSWPCPPSLIGQRFAIHAAKRNPTPNFFRIGDHHVIRDVLGGFHLDDTDTPELPLGAIVGSGVVAACYPIVRHLATADKDCPFPCVAVTDDGTYLYLMNGWDGEITNISDQVPYGDFTPGRYAWLIEDAAPTTERCPWCAKPTWPGCPACHGADSCEPIPAKGRQKIWHWTPEAAA